MKVTIDVDFEGEPMTTRQLEEAFGILIGATPRGMTEKKIRAAFERAIVEEL